MTDSSTPNSATYPPASAGVATRTGFEPDAGGHFGVYGGRHVPEALMAVIDEVTATYEKMRTDDSYLGELDRLQRDYTGRPSPLYEATRLREDAGGARIFLKREDLNHTGSHKINNVLGQALLAARMGKTRVIAETGAGQHGVATATACALLGLECLIYMGRVDTERQALNVARMRLLGAALERTEPGIVIDSFGVEVYLLAISQSAEAMKSSNTFCLCSSMPASCQVLPYSEPPRRFATA